MNAPYLLKRRRTRLSAIWLGSFLIAVLILIVLFGFGFIGKNNLLLTLGAMVHAYSPVLIVAAAFFVGQSAKAHQLHGRPAFIAAVSFSVFWAFCVLGGLFALWRGVIAIEDAGDYLARVKTYLSLLTTAFVAWYLGSESIVREEPMPSDDQESLPKGSVLCDKGDDALVSSHWRFKDQNVSQREVRIDIILRIHQPDLGEGHE